MVLHDISNDAELVEIAAAALGTERLFERDLDRGDVLPVPSGAENPVAEAQGHQVLDHLLAQVVVDTVELVFFE